MTVAELDAAMLRDHGARHTSSVKNTDTGITVRIYGSPHARLLVLFKDGSAAVYSYHETIKGEKK